MFLHSGATAFSGTAVYMLRIPGIRPDDVCFIAAWDLKILSRFDLLLLSPPPPDTHTYTAATTGRRELGARLLPLHAVLLSVQSSSLRGRNSPPAALAQEGKIERMRSGQRSMLDCINRCKLTT